MFIFRSDYLAHPRLQTTRASRKIKNEDELLATARSIPTVTASSVYLEKLSVTQQIAAVRGADILVGVHGAGLSYSLFINEQVGALLELFPGGYRGRYHFRYFAGWAGMGYADLDIESGMGGDTDFVVPTTTFRASLLQLVTDALSKRYQMSRTAAVELVSKPVTAPPPLPPPPPPPAGAGAAGANQAPQLPNIKLKPVIGASGMSTLPPKPLAPGDNGLSAEGDITTFATTDKHRLAVIVPFRDSVSKTSQGHNRTANLQEFIPFMIDFLTKAGREDFDIVVIEQTQGHVFNKGALFNSGFRSIHHEFDYFVLHDVDQLPESENNKYTYPESRGNQQGGLAPVHLCSASSQFDYKIAYGAMVGGALLLTREHFRQVNGYSNFYWGWGQEDDDFYFRLRRVIPQLDRLSSSDGRYKALTHPRVMDLDVTKVFTQGKQHLMDTQSGAFDIKLDGLSNLKSRVLRDERVGPHYRHIITQLEFDWMPTKLDEVNPALPPTDLRP